MRKYQFNTYVVTRFIGGVLNELSDYSVRFHKQGLNHA